jgi:hypothetical protein
MKRNELLRDTINKKKRSQIEKGTGCMILFPQNPRKAQCNCGDRRVKQSSGCLRSGVVGRRSNTKGSGRTLGSGRTTFQLVCIIM